VEAVGVVVVFLGAIGKMKGLLLLCVAVLPPLTPMAERDSCGGKRAAEGVLQGYWSVRRDRQEKGGGVLEAVGVIVGVTVEEAVGVGDAVEEGVGDTEEVGEEDSRMGVPLEQS
jgi:hypothetical protein